MTNNYISAIKFITGGDMGYKKIETNMTFAEVSLLKSMEHNRSLKRLEKINQVIDWLQVEEILLSHYTVGSSREGADALSSLDAFERSSPGEVVPDRFRPGAGEPDQRPNLLQEIHWVVIRSAFTRPFHFFQVSGSSVQRGDEPDQQRGSSAVLPEGVGYQRGGCRGRPPGSIRQPSYQQR